MIKPALKWAGGKTAVMDEIQKRIIRIPITDNVRLFDVFTGGASVAIKFSDVFNEIIINDTNKELINVYKVIQNYPKELISKLNEHNKRHNHDYYYNVRKIDRSDNYEMLDSITKAARTIYLNKTCYNGLYRVNSNGHFNVPIGRQKKISIFSEENITNLNIILQKIKIYNKDFSVIIEQCEPGDIVYMDPPYDKINSASFVEYNVSRFNEFDQERLKNEIDKLTRKGVYVIASNSYTERTAELYKDYIKEESIIFVKRSIASKSSSRKPIEEILIDNIDKVKRCY